jgi:putative membrane protein
MSPFARKLPVRFTSVDAGIVLLVLHLVGVFGLLSPFSWFFLKLTPYNLIISFLILIAHQPTYKTRFWTQLLLFFAIGMGSEWVGVHTGYVFGSYHYGKTLGLSVDGIPWIIGLNWYMLTSCTVALSHKLKSPVFVQALFGSLLMVGLDYLIEPVAVRFNFWQWHTAEIPISNYIGWFFISLPLQYVGHKWYSGNNSAAAWLFLSQLLFFLILHFS